MKSMNRWRALLLGWKIDLTSEEDREMLTP